MGADSAQHARLYDPLPAMSNVVAPSKLIRRFTLARELERVAIEVQALSHRMAAMDMLPLGVSAEQGKEMSDAARTLCAAAEVLYGHRTESLSLFFDNATDTEAPRGEAFNFAVDFINCDEPRI